MHWLCVQLVQKVLWGLIHAEAVRVARILSGRLVLAVLIIL